VNDETFFAWLDGELDAAEAARVGAEVAADPDLSRRAAEHRALQSRVKGAFDAILDAPVPESITAGARADGVIAPKASAPRRWVPLPHWAALAATLVAGIVVGTMMPQRSTAPVQVEGGKLYAAAALDNALDTELASAPSEAPVRIGLTFRDRTGAICRSFNAADASGLACRDDERWRLRGVFSPTQGQSSDYRMAAGMDPSLGALVDSTIVGEPFDAEREKQARERGWR
jgi:hypothetical protein